MYIFSGKRYVLQHWLFMGAGVGFFSISWAYFDNFLQPWWLILSTVFLLWILTKSILYWYLLFALNKSQVNFFLKWNPSEDPDRYWPNNKRCLAIKKQLREKQFTLEQIFKASIFRNIEVFQWVWLSPDQTIRIQMFAFPLSLKEKAIFFQFNSLTCDNVWILTHNIFLPSIYAYPANWEIKAFPLTSNVESLYKYHLKRIQGKELNVLPADRIHKDILEEQRSLQSINIEKGYLFSTDLWSQYGQLTPEGRYQLWKEMLYLKFLGRKCN